MNDALVPAGQDKPVTVKDFFRRIDVVERFAEILGQKNARPYIGSVLIAVASKPELQACSPESIYKSALRAASLELSCDESLHQAQLVPYRNKKNGQMEANMIPHYLGLVNLAQRTGKYRVINYGPIKAGQVVNVDTLSGLLVITGTPTDRNAPTIGYFAYFKMLNGFEKAEYMTVEEIHEHARKWAPSYNNEYGAWKDVKKLPAMEQKTVIRRLLKSADMSGTAGQKLASALDADNVIDGEEIDVSVDAPKEIKTSAHVLSNDLGFDTDNPDPVTNATWNMWVEIRDRAARVDVPCSDVSRGKTTDRDLQTYIKEMMPFVKDAEAQAQAGQQ